MTTFLPSIRAQWPTVSLGRESAQLGTRVQSARTLPGAAVTDAQTRTERRSSGDRRRLVTDLPPALERRQRERREPKTENRARVFFSDPSTANHNLRDPSMIFLKNNQQDRRGRIIDIYV